MNCTATRLATLAACLWLLAPTTTPAAYLLAPQRPDNGAAASGADAAFYRIDNAWQGSTVLWNETERRFGSGAPVASFAWGTGLWGRADWQQVQDAAAGTAASPQLVQRWQGQVALIEHGNARYNECYGAVLGTVALLPLFAPAPALGDCDNAESADPAQTDWTARYSGYIRITEAAEYNFSVLNDDGFFFRLIGADGSGLEIGRDFLNPPARTAFAEDLQLGAGLYGFELGVWNRLGAGAVDLRWGIGCSTECEWSLVPSERLLASSVVLAPGAFALASLALALLGSLAALRKHRLLPGRLPNKH